VSTPRITHTLCSQVLRMAEEDAAKQETESAIDK
jgi:hypothetical protein